ncbi:MAG: protein phosphatase 2C domain-containing protein [Eubacteriales bacterium]|nr:protein phosphatase 2C domain-containing protein [Eubacteriales bacterium]
MKKRLFSDYLDYRCVVSGEMLKDNGEDCFCCALSDNSAVAAVFDGCGGLGACRYEELSEKTGAYVASRAAGGALLDWFQETEGGTACPVERTESRIREYIDRSIGICSGCAGDTGVFSGTMVRDFPTTAAIALVRGSEEFPRSGYDAPALLQCLWAGDSRIYFLDEDGLAQLTTDDLRDRQDAMANLESDSPLSNVIAADGNYVLHEKTLSMKKTGIVFAATDGCFGYLPSPMHFEYMILMCLTGAESPEGFERMLDESIREIAGDDYSFALLGFGFGEFRIMQDFFRKRVQFLEEHYILPIDGDQSGNLTRQLWEEYRGGYERYLADVEWRRT